MQSDLFLLVTEVDFSKIMQFMRKRTTFLSNCQAFGEKFQKLQVFRANRFCYANQV